MFDRIKSLFTGKKPASPTFDPLNVRLFDLNKGSFLDYKTESYQVEEVYIYDWGEEQFSKELVLNNGSHRFSIAIEDPSEKEVYVFEKIRIRDIDKDLPEYIELNGKPGKSLNFKGSEYFLEEENPGFCQKQTTRGDSAWMELVSWDFLGPQLQKMITIEQWDEDEFEASIGEKIAAREFKNLIPAK
ncbi:MAG: hypothetical protein ACI9YL_000375 [Luteibaculaceae bacterium]|jgi:hypothetical protein